MTFSLTGWALYAMLAVLGVMWLDFLFAFIRSIMGGNFDLTLILNYLKDTVYFVFPLFLMVNMFPLDPIGWILQVFFFLGSLGVFVHYLMSLSKRFK